MKSEHSNHGAINPEQYLGYLDKEMHIAGVLSTFCLAVPSLIIERIASLDDKSIAYKFSFSLVENGCEFLVMACVFMLIGAMLFYIQRSRLAWAYGQIALEATLPSHTGLTLEQRLINADSWDTWIPFHCAKTAVAMAVLSFACASFTVYCPSLQIHHWLIATGIIALFAFYVWLIYHNTNKYNQNESIHVPFVG